jgi:hypothetical protein
MRLQKTLLHNAPPKHTNIKTPFTPNLIPTTNNNERLVFSNKYHTKPLVKLFSQSSGFMK